MIYKLIKLLPFLANKSDLLLFEIEKLGKANIVIF